MLRGRFSHAAALHDCGEHMQIAEAETPPDLTLPVYFSSHRHPPISIQGDREFSYISERLWSQSSMHQRRFARATPLSVRRTIMQIVNGKSAAAALLVLGSLSLAISAAQAGERAVAPATINVGYF